MDIETLTTKPVVRIEQWFVGPNDLLYGFVYGHPRIPDGEEVTTSRVVRWDAKNNRAITANTEYVLGSPRTGGAA